MRRLVLRQFRIDVRCPGRDAACKIDHVFESVLRQKLGCALTTSAALAVDNDLAARIKLAETVRQVTERDQRRANVDDLVFVRLAHVEDEDVLAGIETALQLNRGDLRNSILHSGLLYFLFRENATELLVVDQLFHRRMLAANRAVGILAQLQLAELHAQRINQQQAANQGVAFAEDQLDDLCCLNDTQQSGQDAEHAAFRARRNEPRRWRFRIKAAIAWAVFRCEDAGLALKAEDGSVGVRLVAAQHAGVIDEIARREIIGAIRDDVVVLDDLKGIGAGEHRLVLHDIQIRIERLQLFRRRFNLGAANVIGAVDDLTLQIALIDYVEINQAESTDSGSSQIVGERRAESAGTNAEDLRSLQFLLTFKADFRQQKMPRVAGYFFICKLREGHFFFRKCWHF